MLRFICILGVIGLLAACQSGVNGIRGPVGTDHSMVDLFAQGSEAIGLMNTLTLIQHDYDHGRIMRARSRVLAMEKSHRDYAESHRLLKQKIEPARRRLFLHYLRTAEERERQGRWIAAMWAYDQAKTVTIKPERMVDKREAMKLNMRQLRFDELLKQRRREDTMLLVDVGAYDPPKGVSPSDEVYGRLREHYNDQLDDRGERAFREARRFLRLKLPEIAYIELETYMRLQPGTAQGKKTLIEVRASMPDGLLIPSLESVGMKKVVVEQRLKLPQQVTEKQVISAMQSGDLIRARQFAQLYRRNDGKHSEKLLLQVQSRLKKRSAHLFAQGSKAFAKEKLDLAIRYWSDAVVLRPGKPEYKESLHRAKQLKERLSLLRDQKVGHQALSMQRDVPVGQMAEEE